MSQSTTIKLFENQNIRTLWDDVNEKWYFAIVDIVAALTDSKDARNYWYVLKNRLKSEGSEVLTNCKGLKMLAPDGKMRITDAANTEQILRIIQSIPSKKAEPFKLWLAKVGSERLDEIADPEIAVHRAMDYYRKKGHSDGWIIQRLKSIEIRRELTNEWNKGGIAEDKDFAILTNEMYKTWAGMDTRKYKALKGLHKESLRDNMTNLELVLNMLAEASATEIAQKEKPYGMCENISVAKRGASAATAARKQIESETGKPVVTGRNAKNLKVIK